MWHFYCLNFLHSFRTENKHENVCKKNRIEMSKEESILKYNHGEKPIKVPFIIYADMESLLKK